MNSIKGKIKLSYIVLILMLTVVSLTNIFSSMFITGRYDRIILNVEFANSLNQMVKSEIGTEVWDIVSGKKDFNKANQYKYINQIYTGIDWLSSNSNSHEAINHLRVAKRANNTLKTYVDKLGEQIGNNAKVSENEQTLEEIRSVTAVLYDILQQFTFSEIESAAQLNQDIRLFHTSLLILQVLMIIAVIIIAIISLVSLTKSINKPIMELQDMAGEIAKGNFMVRAQKPKVTELYELTRSLNTMAVKIEGLIEENIDKQKNLQKSEMKALQAQITPHFLYNTFDTIIWLVQANKNEEAIKTVEALTSFFRISLSRGSDWITVEKEVEHIRNYLTIQEIRYADILSYSIDVDEKMYAHKILKLMLQPIVENAIYHGVKYLRGRGEILIRGYMENNCICFSVTDTGVGMDSETLEKLRENFVIAEKCGYGLYNINKRIELFYDIKNGLTIESELGVGTTVSFQLPILECDVNV